MNNTKVIHRAPHVLELANPIWENVTVENHDWNPFDVFQWNWCSTRVGNSPHQVLWTCIQDQTPQAGGTRWLGEQETNQETKNIIPIRLTTSLDPPGWCSKFPITEVLQHNCCMRLKLCTWTLCFKNNSSHYLISMFHPRFNIISVRRNNFNEFHILAFHVPDV